MVKHIPQGLSVGSSDYSIRIVMQILAAIVVLVATLGLMGKARSSKAISSARYLDAAMCAIGGGSGLPNYIKDNPIVCIYNRQGCILR